MPVRRRRRCPSSPPPRRRHPAAAAAPRARTRGRRRRAEDAGGRRRAAARRGSEREGGRRAAGGRRGARSTEREGELWTECGREGCGIQKVGVGGGSHHVGAVGKNRLLETEVTVDRRFSFADAEWEANPAAVLEITECVVAEL